MLTATPDPNVEISLYGIQAGPNSFPVPPAISTAICEASNSTTGPNPGAAETIRFSNPSDSNVYNIMFAVAGDGATGTSGAFTEFAQDADLLIMHMSVPEGARNSLHANPSTIGRVAAEADARRLLLSHFMARSLRDFDGNVAAVASAYDGDIEIAEDLKCLNLGTH